MKLTKALLAVLAMATTTGVLQAAPPPYHVENGYYGQVTFRASGSCGFKAVTYKNAWLGNVLDNTDSPVGWGVITASGELLVLEQDYAPTRYSENVDAGVGKDISYTDMAGAELVAFISDHSGCSIKSIVPKTNSRLTIQWDNFKGKDRASMNAGFSGFEVEVCQNPQKGKQCHADKFSGSVIFKGDWSTPG